MLTNLGFVRFTNEETGLAAAIYSKEYCDDIAKRCDDALNRDIVKKQSYQNRQAVDLKEHNA